MLGTTDLLLLFSLCVHRSPLSKEFEQERNLRARKKKKKKKNNEEEREGKRRKKSGE